MRLRVWILWMVVLCCLVTVGCAARSTRPRLPSEGEAWLEVKSEHFTLWTNTGKDAADQLIVLLEDQHHIVKRAMNRLEQRKKIFVVVLRSLDELRAFLRPPATAFAWPSLSPLGSPGIAMAAELRSLFTINHELAHAISYALIDKQPRWFAEGLAGFFQLAFADPETRVATVGVPTPDMLHLIGRADAPTMKQLFAQKGREFDLYSYAWSWAAFSFLLDKYFDQFGRYLAALQTVEGDHDRAWQIAFADLPPEKVDRELAAWITEAKFPIARISIEKRSYPSQSRPLGDSEILSARSLLSYINEDDPASRRDAEAAVAADRTNPFGWIMLAANQKQISIADAQALVKARPSDFQAWRLLTYVLKQKLGKDAPETKRADAVACQLGASEGFTCDPPK